MLQEASLAWGRGAHVCPGPYLVELVSDELAPLLIAGFDVEVVTLPGVGGMRCFNCISIITDVKVRFYPRRLEESTWGREGGN